MIILNILLFLILLFVIVMHYKPELVSETYIMVSYTNKVFTTSVVELIILACV